MESKRSKCKGYITSRLVIRFDHRGTPSSPSLPSKPDYSSTTSKPMITSYYHQPRTAAGSSPAGGGLMIMNQQDHHQVFYHQNKPAKMAFVVPPEYRNSDCYNRRMVNFNGEDESVDDEADKYISRVRERFRQFG